MLPYGIEREFSGVNGCQSLSTIYSSSETAKKATDAYILFRFYEISESDRADKISTSTNSQSAVKARDLRSNDKSVLALKKAYEQFYPDGYFITKRGEKVDKLKYNDANVVNLTDLGKQLIAWQSQRPTISYSETKIFDKYFDQLFHRPYSPENVHALHVIFDSVYSKWNAENPMGLNVTLLSMKAYAPYHQFFAVSVILGEINNMPNDSVPIAAIALEKLMGSGTLDNVIEIAGAWNRHGCRIVGSDGKRENFCSTELDKIKNIAERYSQRREELFQHSALYASRQANA